MAAILEAILKISKRSTMPAWHRSDSDSTPCPLPKSAITSLGVFFARYPPPASGLKAGFASTAVLHFAKKVADRDDNVYDAQTNLFILQCTNYLICLGIG